MEHILPPECDKSTKTTSEPSPPTTLLYGTHVPLRPMLTPDTTNSCFDTSLPAGMGLGRRGASAGQRRQVLVGGHPRQLSLHVPNRPCASLRGGHGCATGAVKSWRGVAYSCALEETTGVVNYSEGHRRHGQERPVGCMCEGMHVFLRQLIVHPYIVVCIRQCPLCGRTTYLS